MNLWTEVLCKFFHMQKRLRLLRVRHETLLQLIWYLQVYLVVYCMLSTVKKDQKY